MLHADDERTFGPDDGVDVGNVTAIQARGPDVWIGGEFGLQRLDQGRFRTLHALDDEALRGISGIVQTANGDLWLNGLGGIVHLAHEEIVKAMKDPAYTVSAERFDRRAGLPGLASQLRQMPTAVEGTDGRLWFTVINGVVWIDPTRASRTTSAPPVSIQSVFADDKLQEPGAVARFAAGTSSVRIVYAAVSLLNPEAVRFRYRLSGIDEDWREAARRPPSPTAAWRQARIDSRSASPTRAAGGRTAPRARTSRSCRRSIRPHGSACCASCWSSPWRGLAISCACGSCASASR